MPPQNFLRINWTGGNIAWNRSNFETNLLNPLAAMLASRSLTNQMDYVVLCMDIPYQVTAANGNKLDNRRVVLRFQDGRLHQ